MVQFRSGQREIGLEAQRLLKLIPRLPEAVSLDQTDPGITNVHSGAQASASDGTSYSTW